MDDEPSSVVATIKRESPETIDHSLEPLPKRPRRAPKQEGVKKRPRGRPPAVRPAPTALAPGAEPPVKRKRGRPPKNPDGPIKRKRAPGDEDAATIGSIDAEIAKLEEDINKSAAAYQECRKIMLMGVVSVEASQQTAKMNDLMDKLKSMKAARKEAIKKRDNHLMSLNAGEEKALVLEEVRELRARRKRLFPRDKEPLTEDHRVRVSSEETYLGRALGAGPSVEIDYRHWSAQVGDIYLLATDGAYDYLDAAAVHAALAAHPDDFDAVAAALVDTALQRGSQDNLTGLEQIVSGNAVKIAGGIREANARLRIRTYENDIH